MIERVDGKYSNSLPKEGEEEGKSTITANEPPLNAKQGPASKHEASHSKGDSKKEGHALASRKASQATHSSGINTSQLPDRKIHTAVTMTRRKRQERYFPKDQSVIIACRFEEKRNSTAYFHVTDGVNQPVEQ